MSVHDAGRRARIKVVQVLQIAFNWCVVANAVVVLFAVGLHLAGAISMDRYWTVVTAGWWVLVPLLVLVTAAYSSWRLWGLTVAAIGFPAGLIWSIGAGTYLGAVAALVGTVIAVGWLGSELQTMAACSTQAGFDSASLRWLQQAAARRRQHDEHAAEEATDEH